MSEIKELKKHEIDKIISFWETSDYKDNWCNAWLGICAACSDGDMFLSAKDDDAMWQKKYKYGKKILRMIAKLAKPPNAESGTGA